MTKCQVIAIDNQKGGVISEVMNKLDISDKKYQFLSFMNKKKEYHFIYIRNISRN